MRITTEQIRLTIYRAIPFIVFVLLWELFVHGNRERIFFFGSPLKIGTYLYQRSLDGSLWNDFKITLIEALSGFIIGNLLGTLIGLGLWYSKTIFLIARPYIIVLGSAPVFALGPLLVIWFGTGLQLKILIAAISTLFIALFQAYTGASEVSREHLRLMETFRASKNQTFRKLIIPSVVVWVIAGLRINVGFAILGAFIGEFLSSNEGLGHLIVIAGGHTDISLGFCGIFLLSCMALLLNSGVSRIEPNLKHWIVKYL